MKYLGLAVAFLPLLAAAAPAADPEVEADGELDLEKRASAQTCKIVNVDTYVNFACWKHGDCYNGVCSWDQVTYLKTTCYVNGYFTDSNCSSKKLPKCK